ncbi:hypothetical protein ACQJBY_029454 [Aegilops geniculata]
MMSANGDSPAGAAATTPRSRLPRWTRHETLVLIQAKRVTEQRAAQPVRLKWAVVSAYCRRHGVERGPMQCRKRWGNLSWDLKKIVAWEKKHAAAAAAAVAGDADPAAPERESFWDMRGEERRARQLPSSFDREVYDAIVGAGGAANQLKPDSAEEMELADDADEHPPSPMMVMPIQARMYVPPASSQSQHECSDPATESAKKPASDKNSTSQQDSEATFGAGVGAEDTDTATATPTPTAAAGTTSMGRQMSEALERGNRLLAEQLEAQRANWDADREHRRALLAAVNKLADAAARIAERL